MEKKMTKREMFTAMIEKYGMTGDDKTFIEHEIELLARKASKDRKPTAKQLENVKLKEEITVLLKETEKMTCSEIAKALQPSHEEDISVNKVSALMKQLIDDGDAVKTMEKRKAYFSIA